MINFDLPQNRIMSVMARDHVLRTSNSSSGFSHESDASAAFHCSTEEESSAASSFSGFSSSLKGGSGTASNTSPLLRRSLMKSAKGSPAIKVKLIELNLDPGVGVGFSDFRVYQIQIQ